MEREGATRTEATNTQQIYEIRPGKGKEWGLTWSDSFLWLPAKQHALAGGSAIRPEENKNLALEWHSSERDVGFAMPTTTTYPIFGHVTQKPPHQ